MRKRRRRRRTINRLIPLLAIALVISVPIIIFMIINGDDGNDKVSDVSNTSSSTDITPTEELEEFWGDDINLTLTQDSVQIDSTHRKWPSESGFVYPEYDLSEFKGRSLESKPLTGTVIFLDPGHGGEDLGAVFPRAPIAPEILESNVNLNVAFALRELLESAGAEVIMTREDDFFYRLYYRSAIVGKYILADFLSKLDEQSANRSIITGYIDDMDKTIEVNNNDDPEGVFFPLGVSQEIKNILDIEKAYDNCLYISLHCNSSEVPDSISGARVFYASNESIYDDEIDLTKEKMEPIYQNYDDVARKRLAELIYGNITSELPNMVFSQSSGAVSATDYAVIREMNLVGVLIEMGFVNHEGDRAVLNNEDNQSIYAQSIYNAIYEYFCEEP